MFFEISFKPVVDGSDSAFLTAVEKSGSLEGEKPTPGWTDESHYEPYDSYDHVWAATAGYTRCS